MYIDPHTEHRYPNDELQAKLTLLGLGAATLFALVLALAMALLKAASPTG